MRTTWLLLLTLSLLTHAPVEASRQAVEVEMRNVNLHFTPDVVLHVRHLRGRFVSFGSQRIPYLDNPKSYAVAVDSGEVAIDLGSLNALMRRTMANADANIERLRISIDEGTLRQKGTIDKAINIPFNIKASVSATPNGRIRVHSESVRGFGIPIKPLMKIFRLDMEDMLKIRSGHGVEVAGNDLILDPATLLPPPAFRGHVTNVRIENNTLVQTFGSGAPRQLAPPAISSNHIYWRGGQLAFGKLTMIETDLELVDMDPSDPFDFSVEHWNQQLVAGYSKSTTRRGLKAHMPDYNDLGQRHGVVARR